MKILDAGHEYELDCLDGDLKQIIVFVKREGQKFPFNIGKHAGTNCQEVLRALIDRTEYLQKQQPCAETECIISSLKTALLLFELRAAREHGMSLKLRHTEELMWGFCAKCGHLTCKCEYLCQDQRLK